MVYSEEIMLNQRNQMLKIKIKNDKFSFGIKFQLIDLEMKIKRGKKKLVKGLF